MDDHISVPDVWMLSRPRANLRGRRARSCVHPRHAGPASGSGLSERRCRRSAASSSIRICLRCAGCGAAFSDDRRSHRAVSTRTPLAKRSRASRSKTSRLPRCSMPSGTRHHAFPTSMASPMACGPRGPDAVDDLPAAPIPPVPRRLRVRSATTRWQSLRRSRASAACSIPAPAPSSARQGRARGARALGLAWPRHRARPGLGNARAAR